MDLMHHDYDYLFELVVDEKNPKTGQPTGRKKVLRTNTAADLEEFWNKNQPRKKKKKEDKGQAEVKIDKESK